MRNYQIPSSNKICTTSRKANKKIDKHEMIVSDSNTYTLEIQSEMSRDIVSNVSGFSDMSISYILESLHSVQTQESESAYADFCCLLPN